MMSRLLSRNDAIAMHSTKKQLSSTIALLCLASGLCLLLNIACLEALFIPNDFYRLMASDLYMFAVVSA
jgi:hypothetical protein